MLMRRSSLPMLVTLFLLAASLSCTPSRESESPREPPPADGPVSLLAAEDSAAPELIRAGIEPWKGDFDAMTERRLIRALVIPNQTSYFFDGVEQRGSGYEALRLLEKRINTDLKSGKLAVYLLIIPTTRDRILADLLEGRGDIAASNLTITAERREQVEFTDPLLTAQEILVTGPGAPPIETLQDLAGQEVHVRRTSSYWDSLERLNRELERQGLEPVRIKAADELLETEDMLEMVNAELIPITVADDYLAKFWAQILDNITIHPDLVLRSDAEIAWAMRPNSPELAAVLNDFVKDHKKGTLTGNILINRYFKNADRIRNSLAGEEIERLQTMMDLLQKYAARYDFDWLMIAAQGYQESRLDQSKRSKAGAIGVMQLLKSTASDPNVAIPDIEKLEPNIHAGTKYLRFLADHYFAEAELDPVDRMLFAIASYNAGPNRIQRLRKKTADQGLDPDVWFRNVEVVVAHDVGLEPVRYVSNIYKYYLAYSLMLNQLEARAEVKG